MRDHDLIAAVVVAFVIAAVVVAVDLLVLR